jgi:hypothetical protein
MARFDAECDSANIVRFLPRLLLSAAIVGLTTCNRPRQEYVWAEHHPEAAAAAAPAAEPPAPCKGARNRLSEALLGEYGLTLDDATKLQVFIDRRVEISREVVSVGAGTGKGKLVRREDRLFEVVEVDLCTPGVVQSVDQRAYDDGIAKPTISVRFDDDADGVLEFVVLHPRVPAELVGTVRTPFNGDQWVIDAGDEALLWVLDISIENERRTKRKLPGARLPEFEDPDSDG